jgi:hypothetical protein
MTTFSEDAPTVDERGGAQDDLGTVRFTPTILARARASESLVSKPMAIIIFTFNSSTCFPLVTTTDQKSRIYCQKTS